MRRRKGHCWLPARFPAGPGNEPLGGPVCAQVIPGTSPVVAFPTQQRQTQADLWVPVKQKEWLLFELPKGLHAWCGLCLPQRAGPSQLCWLLALNLPLCWLQLMGGGVGCLCDSMTLPSLGWGRLRAKVMACVLPLGAS